MESPSRNMKLLLRFINISDLLETRDGPGDGIANVAVFPEPQPVEGTFPQRPVSEFSNYLNL